MKSRPVSVTWIDSVTPAGVYWHNDRDVERHPGVIHTRGFLIEKSKDAVVIASSVGEDDLMSGGFITIPRVAIVKMRRGK